MDFISTPRPLRSKTVTHGPRPTRPRAPLCCRSWASQLTAQGDETSPFWMRESNISMALSIVEGTISLERHGNTDLHFPAFSTSMFENASHLAISINFKLYIWRRKFGRTLFPLACGRRLSLRHAIAIGPLVDSITKLTIDGRAIAILYLTGTFFPGDSNNDQSVGCLQLSSFPALAPS